MSEEGSTRGNGKFTRPTDEENRAINAGIAADPDTYELSAEEFKMLRPVGASLKNGTDSPVDSGCQESSPARHSRATDPTA